MSSNTKNFIDNSLKVYASENNRQFYGGANSYERGEIFMEKAVELREKVSKRYHKGPPKSPKNPTARQASLHDLKVKKWFEDSDKFERKAKIWEDQAGLVKGSLSLEELDKLKASQNTKSTPITNQCSSSKKLVAEPDKSTDSIPDISFSSRPITASTPFVKKSAMKKNPQDFTAPKPRRSSVRRVAFNDISAVNDETTIYHKENELQSFLIDTSEPNRVLIASALNPDQSKLLDVTDFEKSSLTPANEDEQSFRPFHLQTPNMIEAEELSPDDLTEKMNQAKVLENRLDTNEITKNYLNQIAAAEKKDPQNNQNEKRRRNYA